MSLVSSVLLSDTMNPALPITAGVVVVPKDQVNNVLKSPDLPHLNRISYGHAICISEAPFIIVSEDAGMRWANNLIADFIAIAPANPDVYAKCLTRLAS